MNDPHTSVPVRGAICGLLSIYFRNGCRMTLLPLGRCPEGSEVSGDGVFIQSVKLPPQLPNLNAYAERFVRSIKEDCLNRMIFFGEDQLRLAVREYLAHYHTERNHQGLKNALILPAHRRTT